MLCLSVRRLWTRDETLLAFELYFRLSYNQIRDNNPEVIRLANIIGRDPGAVEAKLFNIKNLDPYSIIRNETGLSHIGKIERGIWKEYQEDNYEIVQSMEELRDIHYREGVILAEGEEYFEGPAFGYDEERMQKTRRGQQFFRKGILANCEHKCCITGIDIPELIVASHIKPWKVCTDQEKVDTRNGLCLNRLHDGLFDRFQMTVTPEYRIVYSEAFTTKCSEHIFEQFFEKYEGRKINVPTRTLPGQDFIQYHNEQFAKKNKQSV